jgi:glyoxylate reductase
MARVVASARLPAPVAEILGDGIELVEPEQEFSRAELLQHLADASGLISLLTVAVDESLLAAAPGLKVVANYAVGYDNVDVEAATSRGIAVCNTPEVLTEATADMAFALMLAAARRIGEGERLVRSGQWTGWFPDQLLGQPVFGRTLGIIGLGRIGQAVARRARGFSMKLIYSGRRPVAAADELGAEHVSLDELCERSDFISIHCPLTDDTHHLIDEGALMAMKPTAVVVNTARGAVIDEAALVRVLARGHLGGVGLDVYEREPAISTGLDTVERAVLAPHLGSATTDSRRSMGEICANAVRRVLNGQRPETLVNPEVWQG